MQIIELMLKIQHFIFFSCFFLAVPPLYVRLQGLNHPLVSGVRTHVTCSSAGARPSPQIIWNKGGTLMRGASQTVSVKSGFHLL